MDCSSITQYVNLIEAVCMRRLRHTEDAHACYVFVLDKLMEDDCRRVRSFSGRSSEKTYLVAVTNRLIIDFVRHRDGRRPAGEEPEQAGQRPRPREFNPPDGSLERVPDATAGPEEALECAQAQALVDRVGGFLLEACRELPAEDRVVALMRFRDGMKISDIARRLGLRQRPLYTRVDRLRRALLSRVVETGVRTEEVLEALAPRPE